MVVTRRSMVIESELWSQVQLAAMKQGLRDGHPVSASAWVRDAIRQRLEKEERHG